MYKVRFVAAWYPWYGDPLAGIFTERHALALKDQVAMSVVYVNDVYGLDVMSREEVDRSAGFPVVRVHYRRARGAGRRLINAIRYFRAVFRGHRLADQVAGKPDLYHVHVLTRTAVYPFLQFLQHRTPYIITEHWTRYLPERREFKGLFRRLFARLVVRKSKGVTAVSAALKNAMVHHGLVHPDFRLISNVVDTRVFHYLQPAARAQVRFLHVSSFVDRAKNIRGILDAAALLDRQGYRFDLTLVGEGPDSAMLRRYADSKAYTGVRVEFKGELVGEGLADAYRAADALLVFSNFENQSCAVIEAFACGLPVIATRAGGNPELVTPELGLLVDTGDTGQLAGAMKRFLEREVSFDRERISAHAVRSFSFQKVAGDFLDLYRQSLKN
jgi:L-malate glycosyltransferase